VRQGGEDGEIVLTADEATNRIVAVGEAALLDQLGPLIETIDVRGPQVLVEAMVVTMNESDARTLGVELRKIGTSDDVLYELSSLFGVGAASPGATELPEIMSNGFSAAVLDPGSFSAVVNALQTISDGRSLDMPKVLVQSGQEAKLDSVVESPYLTTTTNNTAATTAFGGSLDAGTSVTVKPQVAQGDELVLAYTVSVSAFLAPPASPALPPPRQQNSLASVVTVPDGYTVVVGGLELETESESASQVPVLGDIPLLGALFRSQTTTRSKDKFYVFLRCSILRSRAFEDLRYLSDRALPDAGLADEWPRIEPRVIR
jgi:general secretion pathway protein D